MLFAVPTHGTYSKLSEASLTGTIAVLAARAGGGRDAGNEDNNADDEDNEGRTHRRVVTPSCRERTCMGAAWAAAGRKVARMSAGDAFFLPDGDGFVATPLTRGPWSRDHQHGGPPAALLARAIERESAEGPPLQVARLIVDYLRPIPIGRVAVATQVERAGRSTRLVRATLSAGGTALAVASALMIRRGTVALPRLPDPPAAPRGPETSEPLVLPFFMDEVGYPAAVDVRRAAGRFGSGAVLAWLRMRVPLLPDEPPSPLQRVMVAADSGHGVSLVLDISRYSFVNPDLSVHLHRMPDGEWIGLDAVTRPEPTGIGLAHSRLLDLQGPIGVALQSQVVDRRPE